MDTVFLSEIKEANAKDWMYADIPAKKQSSSSEQQLYAPSPGWATLAQTAQAVEMPVAGT